MKNLEVAFHWVGSTTFGNVARALLRLRRQEYEALDRLLSQEVLAFLDSIYASQTATFESMQHSVSDMSLDVDDPHNLVPLLEKHHLAELRDQKLILTADCALYMKWRAKKSQQ